MLLIVLVSVLVSLAEPQSFDTSIESEPDSAMLRALASLETCYIYSKLKQRLVCLNNLLVIEISDSHRSRLLVWLSQIDQLSDKPRECTFDEVDEFTVYKPEVRYVCLAFFADGSPGRAVLSLVAERSSEKLMLLNIHPGLSNSQTR